MLVSAAAFSLTSTVRNPCCCAVQHWEQGSAGVLRAQCAPCFVGAAPARDAGMAP
jgi:hypothetical protein